MQTSLLDKYKDSDLGKQADDILRKCVHCGFCLATCPTYDLLGNELDSPRGRIYLIKQVLEGQTPTAKTQTHLDRCLTCRNCETTCPSGVEYGHLVDAGRHLVEKQVPRSLAQRFLRKTMRTWPDNSAGSASIVTVSPASQTKSRCLAIHPAPPHYAGTGWLRSTIHGT